MTDPDLEERIGKMLDSPRIKKLYGVAVEATREETAAAIERFHAEHDAYVRRLCEHTEELKREIAARGLEFTTLEIELDINEAKLRLGRAYRAIRTLTNNQGN